MYSKIFDGTNTANKEDVNLNITELDIKKVIIEVN